MNYPFTDDDLNKLRHMTAYFEGERLSAYLDSKGILTVGIGHNCRAKPVPGVYKTGDAISREVSAALFAEDMGQAIKQVQAALPWVVQMLPARQAVLYDLCFNMGLGSVGDGGLLSFNSSTGTLREVENGNYINAVVRFKQSRWAKDVKARRAEPLMRQLESGQWQELG